MAAGRSSSKSRASGPIRGWRASFTWSRRRNHAARPCRSFVDRFARIYTPAVIALAVLVAVVPPLIGGADAGTWLYRALVLLVISCPCALVISTPVSIVVGALGGGAKWRPDQRRRASRTARICPGGGVRQNGHTDARRTRPLLTSSPSGLHRRRTCCDSRRRSRRAPNTRLHERSPIVRVSWEWTLARRSRRRRPGARGDRLHVRARDGCGGARRRACGGRRQRHPHDPAQHRRAVGRRVAPPRRSHARVRGR